MLLIPTKRWRFGFQSIKRLRNAGCRTWVRGFLLPPVVLLGALAELWGAGSRARSWRLFWGFQDGQSCHLQRARAFKSVIPTLRYKEWKYRYYQENSALSLPSSPKTSRWFKVIDDAVALVIKFSLLAAEGTRKYVLEWISEYGGATRDLKPLGHARNSLWSSYRGCYKKQRGK